MSAQYKIIVHGRVQGVGFRAAARNQARSLQLSGWVENRPDGSVEVVISGTAEACRAFIHWCRDGSGYSWVERLDVQEMTPESFSSFHIKY